MALSSGEATSVLAELLATEARLADSRARSEEAAQRMVVDAETAAAAARRDLVGALEERRRIMSVQLHQDAQAELEQMTRRAARYDAATRSEVTELARAVLHAALAGETPDVGGRP